MQLTKCRVRCHTDEELRTGPPSRDVILSRRRRTCSAALKVETSRFTDYQMQLENYQNYSITKPHSFSFRFQFVPAARRPAIQLQLSVFRHPPQHCVHRRQQIHLSLSDPNFQQIVADLLR